MSIINASVNGKFDGNSVTCNPYETYYGNYQKVVRNLIGVKKT